MLGLLDFLIYIEWLVASYIRRSYVPHLCMRLKSKICAAEMKMLRMSAGVTKMDHINSTYIRGSLFVEQPTIEKMEDRRMDWYCHVLRRPPENPAKKSLLLNILLNGTKFRGTQKHRWIDQMR